MKFPFVGRAEPTSDPDVVDELRGIASRLDRLIELAERLEQPTPRRARAASKPRATRSSAMKLHEAITLVLTESDRPLSAREITAAINERHLFVPPRSGEELRVEHINSRMSNKTYRDRFVRRDGLVSLADGA